jgi:hypothetical protein
VDSQQLPRAATPWGCEALSGGGCGLLTVAGAGGSCPNTLLAAESGGGGGAPHASSGASQLALPAAQALPPRSVAPSTGLRGAWTAGNERLKSAAKQQRRGPPVFL